MQTLETEQFYCRCPSLQIQSDIVQFPSVTLENFMPLSKPAVFQMFSFSYENDTILNNVWENGTSSSDKYAILCKFLGRVV